MSRHVLTLLFLLTASLPFLAMAWRPETSAPLAVPSGEEILTITSPHNRDVRKEYSRAFRAWMRKRHGRSVALRWLDVGGTSKVLKDLESRFATHPDDPGVDILFGGGPSPFLKAADRGWLARVDPPAEILADIPRRCAGLPVYDADHRWFGVALSGFGIITNRVLLEQLGLPSPRAWEDLADPAFFSWVGSGDPRSSGSVHMCYEIILQAYGFDPGWRLITRLCANVRHFGEGGGTGPREVMAGEVAAGLVIDQYAQRTIASMEDACKAVGDRRLPASPLAFVLPAGETVISPDPIAVIRGTDKPDLARLFVIFVLSEEGQRILYQPAGVRGQQHRLRRRPVRRSLYAKLHAPAVDPYAAEAELAYDDATASLRWRALNDLIGCWCIDPHWDLQAAWTAVLAAGAPDDLVERLTHPPLTEPELATVAGAWKDTRRRLDVMEEWSRRARARYRTLRREARQRPQTR